MKIKLALEIKSNVPEIMSLPEVVERETKGFITQDLKAMAEGFNVGQNKPFVGGVSVHQCAYDPALLTIDAISPSIQAWAIVHVRVLG